MIIPSLFFFEEKKKKKEEKNKIKTGLELLMERNKKKIENIKKDEISLENYIVSFIKSTEQNYSIVNEITYTYMKTISEELKVLREKEEAMMKNKNTVSSDEISTKLSGR